MLNSKLLAKLGGIGGAKQGDKPEDKGKSGDKGKKDSDSTKGEKSKGKK